MILWRTLMSLSLCAWLARSEIRLSLDSNAINGTWRVCNGNSSINIEGTVPGGIYTDLQKARVLHDNLFYRFNDLSYRWVGKENWTYGALFDLPEYIFRYSAVNLVFHGIDTIADLCLNGQQIAYVNNMFGRYTISVKEHLKEKKNFLQVRFQSPIHAAQRLALKQAAKYKIPPDCPPLEQYGECHINFLRKMQASFSWDWGPAFPSVGIWKSVELEAFDHAIVRDVTVTTKAQDSRWIINCTAYVEGAHKFSYALVATVYPNDNEDKDDEYFCSDPIVTTTKVGNSKWYNFTADILLEVPEGKLEKWWPSGFGNQTLYKLTVDIIALNRQNQAFIESTKEVKFGFRTVELVQEPIMPNKTGLSFYLKVNGVPIFAKGSNWIPVNILPEMTEDEVSMRHLMLSAKEAHMNMLRVWGGGIYESDLFYEMADELGIMIWQDMMFAVAMYPSDKRFLGSVTMEIEQQIRRLQHHPSIVLWAGNNENEAALRGNWFNTQSDFELYKRDYVKLFVDTIESIIKRIDDSRPYVVSSPSNGLKSREEGHISADPYSPLYGDVHYYNYDDDPFDPSSFVNTRFASEYGFQSMPSFLSLTKVSKYEDRKLSSRFSLYRQHHRRGYEEMSNLIKYHLPMIVDDGSEAFYKKFIYYTQISQAMSMKVQTEKYRRDRGRVNEMNEKFTMGALYWQLNDVWEAPTWSSIEYGGKWKMLHYYASKFFEPLLISGEITDMTNLDVYIVSDALDDIPSARLNLTVYSWSSFTPKQVLSYVVDVEGSKSKIYATLDLNDLLDGCNCTDTTCFLHFSLDRDEFYTENIMYLSPFSNMPNLEPASVKARACRSEDPTKAVIKLETDRIAPFVWLEADTDGLFSDNGFLLIRNTVMVTFRNRGEAINFDRLRKTLKVRSLLRC